MSLLPGVPVLCQSLLVLSRNISYPIWHTASYDLKEHYLEGFASRHLLRCFLQTQWALFSTPTYLWRITQEVLLSSDSTSTTRTLTTVYLPISPLFHRNHLLSFFQYTCIYPTWQHKQAPVYSFKHTLPRTTPRFPPRLQG